MDVSLHINAIKFGAYLMITLNEEKMSCEVTKWRETIYDVVK